MALRKIKSGSKLLINSSLVLTRRRAILELIFAGCLWGLGFVTTIWALEAFSPSEILIWRFFFAAVFSEIVWKLVLKNPGFAMKASFGEWKLAFPAGLLLAGLLLPQTIGLLSISASKSAFLTTLYVVLVPLIAHLLLKKKVRGIVIVFALMALVGAFFLTGADLSSVSPGDLWTLLCALLASLHILYIERVSDRIGDPFRFNTMQTVYCLLVILPLLLTQQNSLQIPLDLRAWICVLTLALGSTVIAFTIQVRTQRVLDSTTASMLFLLESPFALAFGALFLGETLNLAQGFGAALILLAAMLTVKFGASADLPRTTPQ